jgi:hypothetical protein
MPFLDRSASRPGCAEAGLLGSSLGLASPRSSFRLMLQGNYCVRQRRASVMRALIILALLGLFCGSAVMMSEKPQPPPDAAPVQPPDPVQAPVRAHAKAGPTLPALSPSGTTYCLSSEEPGEAPAAKRLIADADTASGAFHARSC